MLLIPCPHCGNRHESEFSYGGDASRTIPDSTLFDDWYAFVYERGNSTQEIEELWHHSYGCGQWMRLRRNVFSNEFVADVEKDQ